MIGRLFTISMLVTFIVAFFMSSPKAQEIPCLSLADSVIFEPVDRIRGFGTRDDALVKLSVADDGMWLLTLAPPELEGAICVVMMGTNWTMVEPKGSKIKVRHGRRD